jgi:hypothetical protein
MPGDPLDDGIAGTFVSAAGKAQGLATDGEKPGLAIQARLLLIRSGHAELHY